MQCARNMRRRGQLDQFTFQNILSSSVSDLYATYWKVSRVPSTRSMYSFSSSVSIAFLMSGIFGVNRAEICEITSWINAWFFIVLRAFMILFGESE